MVKNMIWQRCLSACSRSLALLLNVAPGSLHHADASLRLADGQRPLAWRTPWWRWQMLSWLASTLLAPTLWIIGTLLLIDSRSDYPLLWPALMLTVALSNAIAIIRSNQRHHRQAFTHRLPLALHYLRSNLVSGGLIFLLLGWGSGFLHDLMGPLASFNGTPGSPAMAIFWSVLIALLFCCFSFLHAGLLHTALAFQAPAE